MPAQPRATAEALGKTGALLLVGAALALRLAYLALAPQPPILWDAAAYRHAGTALAEGYADPQVRALLGLQGPGYSLFLAAVFSLWPDDVWAVRSLQAGIGALTCLVVASLGRRLAGRRAGLLAGWLTAVYPPLVVFAGRLLTETLGIFLFWLALDLLVRGWRDGRLRWLAPAGLVAALACLTRPTLLPTAAFLVMAVGVAARPVSLRRRALESAAFAVPLAGILLAWNALAPVDRPTVGAGGLTFVIDAARQALSPSARGWAVEGRTRATEPVEASPGYARWLGGTPRPAGYAAAAVANLVFYHLWFPENAWRDTPVLSPAALHAWHRALVLLGLGGLGIAVARWRTFAPLLALAPPFAIMAVTWIEIRHNLPFLPGLFVLAAVFVVSVAGWLRRGWEYHANSVSPAVCGKWVLDLGGAAVLTAAVFWGTRLLHLAALFPSANPVSLGRAGDVAAVLLVLLWGAIIIQLARPSLGRAGAVVAGLLPATLFAALFGSYAAVGSEPRWRAWDVDCGHLAAAVTQTIELPAPLPAEDIASAQWLVDLQTDGEPPPLRVGVNGTWLTPSQVAWDRWSCPAGIHPCAYFSAFAGRPLSAWPQWWSLRVDPATVADSALLTLTLVGESRPGGGTSPRVYLGGTFCRRRGDSFQGPNPGLHFSRSLYRWVVAGDWRLWANTPLGSRATSSGFAAAEGTGAEQRTLARLLEQGYGTFNIRLLVKFKDGREVLY